MKIHRMEEIYIHQLMLLPFPTGISIEYFPHLKMISEALIDFMFLKNIHIVDWLWQNKIHKWWRMAKGDNPIANIIKKYPFEVQQIKQLLNSNIKVILNNRLDLKKKHSKKNIIKKKSTISNCIYYKMSTSTSDINIVKFIESSELSNLRIRQFPLIEQNNTALSPTEKNSQNINLFPKVSKDNVFDRKSSNISQSSLIENFTDNRTLHYNQIYSNKRTSTSICNIPAKISANIPSVKSSDLSDKVRNNRIIFIERSDQVNIDPFHSHTKHKKNSQKLSIIRSDKVQFLKKSKTIQFHNLHQSDSLIPHSKYTKNEIITDIIRSTNESDSIALPQKQVLKFCPNVDFQNHKSCSVVSENNDIQEIPKENIPDIPSTNIPSRPSSIIIKKQEKIMSKSEDNVDLRADVSTKLILEKLFKKKDLEFLTIKNSEKGKSFLAISKQICPENNSEYRKRMLSSLSKINKNKIHFQIDHIKSLSKKYSEKFYVLNDEIIEGHTNLIRILENIVENIDLPKQSTEDDFGGLLFNTTSSSICSTCHQIKRSASYSTGFLEPFVELNHCLCFNFVCFRCNMFQGNKKRFDNHLKYHQLEYPFKCPECEIEFLSSTNLEIHTWTKCFHQFAKRFLFCTICEIGGFCSMEAIMNHFVVMHSMKITACSLCCMVFEYEKYYISHIRKSHPEVKNYTKPLELFLCQLDDRIIPIEYYNDHIMNHKCIEEITFYYCNLCFDMSKKFETLESIKTHIYENHLAELSNVISKKSLNEILSMEEIQAIFKKQVHNKSFTKLGPLNDCYTAISTNVRKEYAIDDSSKGKNSLLTIDKNPLSILAKNITPFIPILGDKLHGKESLDSSDYFLRYNSPTKTHNSEKSYFSTSQSQYSKQFDDCNSQNKPFKVQEHVINCIPKSSNYSEINILAKPGSDDILNIASTENHQNLIINDNDFLTRMNKRSKKNPNILPQFVNMNMEDLKNNGSLDFEKDRQNLRDNIHQLNDLWNKTIIEHSYSDDKLSIHTKKMNQVDVLNNTLNHDISIENNTLEQIIQDETSERITLVHEDVTNTINEHLSVTCLNPCLTSDVMSKSNFIHNAKHNEGEAIKSNQTDNLHQDYKINILLNTNFELTFLPRTKNQEIDKSNNRNIIDNYENNSNEIEKQNFYENDLTTITKRSTILKVSNDYTHDKDISLNINRNFESDIVNNITNDIDTQESSNLEKGHDGFITKHSMILPKEKVRIFTRKSTNIFSQNRDLQNNISINLNRKSLNAESNSKVFNSPNKKIRIIGNKNILKLQQSPITNVRQQSEKDISNCMIPDYLLNTKCYFIDTKSYVINLLPDEQNTSNRSENTSMSYTMIDLKAKSYYSNTYIDNIFYDSKNIYDYAKFELMKYSKGTKSKNRQKEFWTKNKISDSLSLNANPTYSITLSSYSNTQVNKNIDNLTSRRLENAGYLCNKIILEQTKHSKNSIKSPKAIDFNEKLNENNSSEKMYNLYLPSEMKGHDIFQSGLEIPNQSRNSFELKDEIYLPPIELKNLSLADNEKVNLSKTSFLRSHKLKWPITEKQVMNSKKLQPRIFNQPNSANKSLIKIRKDNDPVFHKLNEKNYKNIKKQETTAQQGKPTNKKLIKKKQKNLKFNANIKSKATLLQDNILIGKKSIIERLNTNNSLKVKENLKKCWSHSSNNDNRQSSNKKSNKERLHPQLSLSNVSKTPSKKNKAIRIKIANKNRIGFFNNECSTVKSCEFKCHLCGDLINTTWETLNHHYGTKHSENYEVYHVYIKLSRIFKPDMSVQTHMQKNNNKRKSIEVLNTRLQKRKRRNIRSLSEKSDDTVDRTSGLYVKPEPIMDDKGNFKCKKCDEICTNITSLRRHIYNNHRLSEKNLICLECGENFVVSPSLQMHLKAFHEIDDPINYMNKYPDYALDIMNFGMRSEVTINNQCHVCMAVFKDSSCVDKHLRIHGMAFLNKRRLETRKAKMISQKKVNTYNELDRALKLSHNEQSNDFS
ncbi:uncharacterized protein LOC131674380 isoform X2 [Phymastichus coffea]|nr:uncharacterized protein LOC131674380 isoform X2 [Phymastichus coffea]